MAATKDSGSASPGVLKTRLFKAAKSGDVRVLRDVLDAGVDVDGLDGNKWTALHEACRWGQLEAVEVLLAAGADPNMPHPQLGYSPMFVATFEKGHTEIVRALLRGGAAPSLASPHGWCSSTAAPDLLPSWPPHRHACTPSAAREAPPLRRLRRTDARLRVRRRVVRRYYVESTASRPG